MQQFMLASKHRAIGRVDVDAIASSNFLAESKFPMRTQRVRSSRFVAHASDGDASEDLIARLKAAEDEAKELKQKLDAVNATNATNAAANAAADTSDREASKPRIDGADLRRETLSFVDNKPRNWLSESDIEFFTGGGPSELEDRMRDDSSSPSSPSSSSSSDSPPAPSSIVQRRLIVGIGLSAFLGAFALVPTERLQPAPSKPLFFYLVPLLRVQALLDEVLNVATDGDYDRMSQLLALIEGPPNNVQQNLKSASAALAAADGRLAQRADTVGRDVYEYLKGVDYQTYFESRGGAGGDQAKEFFEFSRSSARAASAKLDEFLRLMPEDQLEAAKMASSGGV